MAYLPSDDKPTLANRVARRTYRVGAIDIRGLDRLTRKQLAAIEDALDCEARRAFEAGFRAALEAHDCTSSERWDEQREIREAWRDYERALDAD